MKKAFFYQTEIGKIGVAEENGAVTNVFFGNTVVPKEYELKETPLLLLASKELKEYLSGTRRAFSLPLNPQGTPFEQEVWRALLTIPYGETRTYGEIAKAVGRPKACRAVGRANGLNPISIFIPCHRVVGKNGTLTGYAGGLQLKEQLLQLEQAKLA